MTSIAAIALAILALVPGRRSCHNRRGGGNRVTPKSLGAADLVARKLLSVVVAACTVAAGPASAQSVDKFDAVCRIRISQEYSTRGYELNPPTMHNVRVSVDLTERHFCHRIDADCTIISMEPRDIGSTLDLSYRRTNSRNDRGYDVITIILDRPSGQVEYRSVSQNYAWSGTGQCQREPFTPLPVTSF